MENLMGPRGACAALSKAREHGRDDPFIGPANRSTAARRISSRRSPLPFLPFRTQPARTSQEFYPANIDIEYLPGNILPMGNDVRTFTAFAGEQNIASGNIRETLLRTKEWIDHHSDRDTPVVFEDQTGNPIDFDLRGTPEEALDRLSSHPLFAGEHEPRRAGPGRPKLGVISREVSLLPRHWEWLEAQRGGISVTVRALVEEARKRGQSRGLARRAREATGKFMWTIAGNLPDFEEASRALYAKDDARLRSLTAAWPKDIKKHVARLVAEARRLEEEAELEEKRAHSPKA
jgi:hypothetical protein